jgi:hypothetical protein
MISWKNWRRRDFKSVFLACVRAGNFDSRAKYGTFRDLFKKVHASGADWVKKGRISISAARAHGDERVVSPQAIADSELLQQVQ